MSAVPADLQPLVTRPHDVRVFGHERRAGVADVAPSGRLRMDAIARWVQDVAWADVEDAGLRELTIWLVRRTRMRIDRFPRLDERCRLDTYVTGVGRMWAERRTDLTVLGPDGAPAGASPEVQVACIWVHIDPSRLLPSPVHQVEIDTWTGPSTRPVKARLRHPAPTADAAAGAWSFRASELDIAAHVNNAAYFTPLDDELLVREGAGGLALSDSGREATGVDVEIEYRTPAQAGEKRWLGDGAMRWLVEPGPGEVLASAVLAGWPLGVSPSSGVG